MVKCGEWVAAAARAAPVTARISGSSCRCDDPGVTVFTVSATGTLRRMVRCAGKEVRPARNEMTRPGASSFLDTLERTGPVCEQNGGAPDERWCGRQGRRDEHSGYESPLQPSSRTCTTPLQPQALSSLPGISIHAPARGATRYPSYRSLPAISISIHAPARGATLNIHMNVFNRLKDY